MLGAGRFRRLMTSFSYSSAVLEPETILIFGDSNTWGFNPAQTNGALLRFPYSQRWTTLLQSKLDVKYPNKYRIIVEGLNARTTILVINTIHTIHTTHYIYDTHYTHYTTLYHTIHTIHTIHIRQIPEVRSMGCELRTSN